MAYRPGAEAGVDREDDPGGLLSAPPAIDPLPLPEALHERPGGMSILLVEDNPGDIRLVREAFDHGTRPLRLTIVHDGLEALAMLQRAHHMPDLILLDLNLPGLDGRSVLRRIKSAPETMRIPVVVLTNSDAPQDVRGAYDLHANCYLVKPPDYAGFERALRQLLDFWGEVAHLPDF
ncbi:MAG TPA: response regulator [Planctomycetota bacterium]